MNMKGRRITPWGMSDDSGEKDAEGITFFSTPSHGGIFLSAERNRQVNPIFRTANENCKGFGKQRSRGWYEEDNDVAFVYFTFPEVYGVERSQRAAESIKRWYPELWSKYNASKSI